MTRFINPVPKFTDQSGDFMPYGLLYFYESGTNTDKTTYSDVNQEIPNTQPLVLNGDGSVPNCEYSGSAKVILITNVGSKELPINGAQQWERDPVTSSSIGAIGREWDAVSTYDFGSVVIFNTIYYVSIINNNQNNIPNSTLTAWTQFDLLKRWNVNESYNVRDPVIATDFTLYISQVGSNLGNDPLSSPSEWLPSGAGSGGSFTFAGWDLSIDYPVGGTAIVTGSDDNYYVSIQTPNLNQDPISSPAFWTQITFINEGNIDITGNTISSTETNSDIDIAPNGTGELTYNGVEVANTTELALKAPILSPVFTGSPEAPNPSFLNNDERIATTFFVKQHSVGGVVIASGSTVGTTYTSSKGTTGTIASTTSGLFREYEFTLSQDATAIDSLAITANASSALGGFYAVPIQTAINKFKVKFTDNVSAPASGFTTFIVVDTGL